MFGARGDRRTIFAPASGSGRAAIAVIRISGHGMSKMFTLRKISFGIGVERAIPYHSPRLEKIEVMRSGHVRRSRLYFLRDRTGKAARLDEKVDRREEGAPVVPSPAAAKAHAPAHVARP